MIKASYRLFLVITLSVISFSPAFCMDAEPSQALGLKDVTKRVTKYVRIDDQELQAPGAKEFEDANACISNADKEYKNYKKFKYAEKRWKLSRIAKIDGADEKVKKAQVSKNFAKVSRLNYLKDAATFLEVALQSGFPAAKTLAMVCFQLSHYNSEYKPRMIELLNQIKDSSEAEAMIFMFGL